MVRLAAIVACCLFMGAALAQNAVDRAKSLLREGKPKEAFELLDAAAAQLNDAESAYLHGIAALDSGKAGLAIMAFERSLAYDPNFAPSRAELIRALVAVGETDQARVELRRMAGAEVPPEVRQKLQDLEQQLGAAIDVARRRTRGISAYLEADLGYDSNVNTGADDRTFAIPLFGGATATLNRVFQKHASSFGALGGGLLAYNEIQPGFRLFAGIDFKGRLAFKKLEDENYRSSVLSVNVGARWQLRGHTVSAGFTGLENKIGKRKFDEQSGSFAQWQTQVGPSDEIGVFAQWLDQRHPVQPALDTKLDIVGTGWRHALDGKGSPVITLSGYVGNDKERGTDPTVGRDIGGVRLAFERQLEIGAKLVSSAAYQKSTYGGENLFFFAKREDKRADLSLGLVFTPAKDYTVTPQYQYTSNRSTIPVVAFTRHQIYVTLRRDFN